MTEGADRSIPAFLKRHPVILLLLLTPGIPEYLSSSSPVSAIIFNPFQFLFQIIANLGLYGCGALLIHDAKIRWRKGWATVLLLGGAYGILEEGVALSTIFNPNAGPVGSLGIYGHWGGVNWVWAAGIVPFHAVFSIAVPILLLGLAIPQTRQTRLLTGRGTAAALVILSSDVVALMAIVEHVSGYWMGTPILVLSLVSTAVLVWLGRRAPADALSGKTFSAPVSNKTLAVVGMSFFPVVTLTQGLGQGAKFPAVLDFVLVLLVQALYLLYLAHNGEGASQRGRLAFVAGLIIPIAVIGVIAELPLPLTLFADAGVLFFFRRLWAMHGSGSPSIPEAL